jgi:hypothetical protein
LTTLNLDRPQLLWLVPKAADAAQRGITRGACGVLATRLVSFSNVTKHLSGRARQDKGASLSEKSPDAIIRAAAEIVNSGRLAWTSEIMSTSLVLGHLYDVLPAVRAKDLKRRGSIKRHIGAH